VHVDAIWLYPVKSMMGVTVERAELGPLGLVGDRTWATRDLVRGGIRGAKKIGALMELAARPVAGGHAEITLPDGTVTTTADEGVHELVSAALGHEVRLEALRPADDLDHYRRGAPDGPDPLTEIRAVMGREGDEPLPDFSVFPPEIVEFESPPGTYYDAFALVVQSTASLRALSEALPASVIDVRRFRPSLLVDTGDDAGHPELGWAGRRAQLGEAEIEFVGACPRCVMVTRRIDDGVPEDRSVLRHVVRDLGQCVGQYARVVRPGAIAVGDEVRFVS
jgi:uncharacterized protein YcbX